MSRRQQNYARQPADFRDARQNKCYKRLEKNLGFNAVYDPNRLQTRSNFQNTLKTFYNKGHGGDRATRMKFNCIFQNYLLYYLNWIFGSFSNEVSPAYFARFISAIISSAQERIELIDNDTVDGLVNIRLLHDTRSALVDTVQLFTEDFDSWKLHTGYVHVGVVAVASEVTEVREFLQQ